MTANKPLKLFWLYVWPFKCLTVLGSLLSVSSDSEWSVTFNYFESLADFLRASTNIHYELCVVGFRVCLTIFLNKIPSPQTWNEGNVSLPGK